MMASNHKKDFNPSQRNIIFVGLDCATYWIVEKLVAEGRMPNLARLMAQGVTFHTECEEPVVSPVVWTSIATAKSPEKHGVKSFHATSASVKTKRIWDIFLDRGAAVGIMGHFVIWPPQKVRGFMVPDLLALDDQTQPEDLRFLRKLTESSKSGRGEGIHHNMQSAWDAYAHGVRLSTLWSAFIQLAQKKFSKRPLIEEQFGMRVLKQCLYADVFTWLWKKYRPQYAYFHNHLIDTSSHIFWKYLEPQKFGKVPQDEVEKYGDYLFKAFEHADATLGQILTLVDEDTVVIVASDHGAKAAVEQARQWRIPTIKSENLMQALNIERDVSYSNVGFDILVKPRIESDENKANLKQLFSKIQIVEDQLPLFQILEQDASNIWLRLNNAIEDLSSRHVRIKGHEFNMDRFVHASNDRTSGVHDGKNAILVLCGRGVKQGVKIKEKAHVMDIVPTILALSAMPVGRDMDGTVLTEALEDDFLESHPIEKIDTHDEPHSEGHDGDVDMETSKELKNQLRALGYL
ncbi:hypothetical protein GWO43_21685 [candidate division KSB1 bacterium]|nr:hypothetical protein [candidate division KSB1 bacterium]NIR72205.1 hypothetical protein [candidate division KSB1 bacterium]NIS26670.1 hypothetical protein [candidate division KSB1 bacterium]NIT73438.1 hypothetical protein [candidate division KSB1 bacterium]NIU27286.1 hypothetical protein [candidate division KSB1 bacterium]